MSQNEHDSGDEIRFDTPKQVITLLALTALVPIVVIVLVTQFITNMRSVDKDSAAMAPDAVAKRLKPVGDLAFADAPAAPGSAAGKADGKKIYETACAACHGAGVAGAPKPGDKAAWAQRVKAGANALYASALKGKGAMPAKGGNATLADADVKAAVDYLMGTAK